MTGLTTLRGTSVVTDARAAVADIARQVTQEGMKFVLVFCSPKYDLDVLADELAKTFPCPVYGCTSSGQLGPNGFQVMGMAATSFASDDLDVRDFVVRPLSACAAGASELASRVGARRGPLAADRKSFALCFVDGLSLKEERFASALYQSLGDVPIIGGSAGDDLAFERTYVLVDGRFVSDAASVLLFETSLPFVPFKFQHFVASEGMLVVTSADPDRRIVREIDGLPAVEAYASRLGLRSDELTPEVFSKHPLVLTIRGEHYVRSVQRANPDGSIAFFCAMEEGSIVSMGEAVDAVRTVRDAFARVASTVGQPEVVIGCDCILRRLEFESREMAGDIGAVYAANRVVGFSTYGEQYNALHVNQTFTGVAIGGRQQ